MKQLTLNQLIDDIDKPVLVVDSEGSIHTANKHALYILQKKIEDVVNQKGGVVMSCQYATLPGGCGKTEHCSGCDIRNTVMATFEDHQPHDKRALLFRQSDNGGQEVYFSISTQLMDDFVLLTVNNMG